MAKSKKGQKKAEENGQEVLDKNDNAGNEVQEDAKVEEKSELDQLRDEVEEHKDKYLRLYSEFDNYRRRTSKERLELIKTANEELVIALLPVVDDFERAQKASEGGNDEGEKEGVSLIYHKLVKVLEQKGVKEIETNKGDDFNDEIHEAITQIPAPEEDLKGKIVDVVEKGYYLEEKVVRFAKVVTGA